MTTVPMTNLSPTITTTVVYQSPTSSTQIFGIGQGSLGYAPTGTVFQSAIPVASTITTIPHQGITQSSVPLVQ